MSEISEQLAPEVKTAVDDAAPVKTVIVAEDTFLEKVEDEVLTLLKNAHSLLTRLIPTHLKDQTTETVKKLDAQIKKIENT
jgi:hypothetical protein